MPHVGFLTFSLLISGRMQTHLISVATAYVQVAIIFDLDHNNYVSTDLTASSLPLFRLFSPDQPEGTCLDEIHIKSLPRFILREGFFYLTAVR